MKKQVFCRLQFEAIHRCPKEVCPADKPYLANPHRHIFHVKASADVTDNNREIEFIGLKHDIQAYCHRHFHMADVGTASCEDMAEAILTNFPALASVQISEDEENGCVISRN